MRWKRSKRERVIRIWKITQSGGGKKRFSRSRRRRSIALFIFYHGCCREERETERKANWTKKQNKTGDAKKRLLEARTCSVSVGRFGVVTSLRAVTWGMSECCDVTRITMLVISLIHTFFYGVIFLFCNFPPSFCFRLFCLGISYLNLPRLRSALFHAAVSRISLKYLAFFTFKMVGGKGGVEPTFYMNKDYTYRMWTFFMFLFPWDFVDIILYNCFSSACMPL